MSTFKESLKLLLNTQIILSSIFSKIQYLPKSNIFQNLNVTLPSDSLQFQKQLMIKSETRIDFKPLGNL